MLSIIGIVVAAVGGFVFGVLFGRKNKKKVEEIVATSGHIVNDVKSVVKK